MKLGSKALAIILLFVGLVLVNYLASSLPARLDSTADSIYSLSPGTKAILGKIEPLPPAMSQPAVIDEHTRSARFQDGRSGLRHRANCLE